MDAIMGFHGLHRFLSNFYRLNTSIEDTFKDEVIYYPTVEHAYQAMKSLDLEVRKKIAGCKRPRDAKRMGRKIRIRKDWEEIKLNVMLDLLREKFSDHGFAELLLRTNNKYLFEVNDHGDRYWGVDIFLEGENHLGQLLMQVRDELRDAL